MPKMKTHRGAAKRFHVTAKGKLVRRHGYNSHLFTNKSAKRKRHLNSEGAVDPADDKNVRRALGVKNAR
jgi:large subunit ribosomal protein L35